MIDEAKLQIQQCEVYKAATSKFYDSYLPLVHGEVHGGNECGFYYFPFNSKECRQTQPMGHVNLTKLRDCDIQVSFANLGSKSKKYATDYTDATPKGVTKCNTYVAIKSLNVGVCAGGTFGLRFA